MAIKTTIRLLLLLLYCTVSPDDSLGTADAHKSRRGQKKRVGAMRNTDLHLEQHVQYYYVPLAGTRANVQTIGWKSVKDPIINFMLACVHIKYNTTIYWR